MTTFGVVVLRSRWAAFALSLLLFTISSADVIELFDGKKLAGTIESYADGSLAVVPADDNAESASVAIEDATTITFDARTRSENENRRIVDRRNSGDDTPVKLRAGYHKLVVVYSGRAPRLQFSKDGEVPAIIPDELYFAPEKIRNFKPSPGLDEEGFRIPDSPGNIRLGVTFRQYSSPTEIDMSSLTGSPLKFIKSGWNRTIASRWGESTRNLGIFTALVSLDSDGEYRFFLAGNKNATLHLGAIPPEIMVLMERKQIEKAAWVVDLAAGGTIAGSIESWDEKGVKLKTLYPQLPTLQIPTAHIKRVVRAESSATSAIRGDSDQDIVIARVNDERNTRILGTVNGLADGKLSIKYKDQNRTIALDKVLEIGVAGTKYSVPKICYQQLELSSICSFPTTLQSITETGVVAKTAWGQQVSVTHDGGFLLRMVIRNGRVQFLSETSPSKVEETPFFDRMMRWRTDQSLTGSPLMLGQKEFRRGIAMHSRTKLSYDLGGTYDRFMAQVGIAPEMSHLGNVSIRVIGDDQVLFETDELSGTDVSTIDVPVDNIQLLTLVTDFGQGQDVGDRVHWVDARIVRGD